MYYEAFVVSFNMGSVNVFALIGLQYGNIKEFCSP